MEEVEGFISSAGRISKFYGGFLMGGSCGGLMVDERRKIFARVRNHRKRDLK